MVDSQFTTDTEVWKAIPDFPGYEVSDQGLVHRLVLFTFVGPCPLGMECCHADGTRTNNFLKNLRWDTHINNYVDAKKHGTLRVGNAKLTESQVRQIRELASQGYLQKEIGKLFDVSPQTISATVLRHIWQHV